MSIAVSSPLPLELESSRAPKPRGRMLQLDGIRGLAVLSVLAWHWIPQYLTYCPLGVIAVRVFFTLSGFLITGILLKSRDEHEELGGSWWGPIRHFYIRRVLRIFPLYYLVLALILIGGVVEARQHAFWHLTYLGNFLGAWSNNLGGSTAHFWSLSVEEQFYTIWPWFVLFMPRKAIPYAIGIMLATGPLHRMLVLTVFTNQNFPGVFLDYNFTAASNLPFACLDSLGAGALLAWAINTARRTGDEKFPDRVANTGLMIGLPIFILGMVFYNLNNMGVGWVICLDFGVALTTMWVIFRASTGRTGLFGAFLELPPLLYMGTISYCVYVLHPFIHNITPHLYHKLKMNEPPELVQVLVDFLVTLAIASASWFVMEKRLIKFGRSLTPDPVRVGA